MWTRFFLQANFLFIIINNLPAQEYRAINGSLYAGNLAVTHNPSSIVNLPNTWDFTPMALQFKYTTNALAVSHASYLPKWKNAVANLENGTFKRYLIANADLRFLSTHIRLNSNSAIAFGISGRMFLSAKTSTLNGQDTIGNLREFIGINQNHFPMSGTARGNSWMEYYGTYARTLKVSNNSVLNAGITLKLNRGLVGGYLNADGLETVPGLVNNVPGYYLNNGTMEYGYSANMDVFDTATTFINGWKGFFSKTKAALGIDVGAEYIIPGSGEVNGDYDFKIGVSLLDIGSNKFQYSNLSRIAALNKPNVSDSLIEIKFKQIYDAVSLADSLQSVAGTINTPAGAFRLIQPARFVISADKYIASNFSIHADLTLPLASIPGKNQLFTKEMNFLNFAIHYETRLIGFYLPASLNANMNFWMGGAVRAGPLLLGIHNWANVLSKNKIQNGGAYLALIFRFGNEVGRTNEKGCEYESTNGQRNLKRQMKQLNCPTVIQ